MEKKQYMAPQVEQIASTTEQYLLDWSAEKVAGGGSNTPEAKDGMFDDEDGWNGSHNLWDD